MLTKSRCPKDINRCSSTCSPRRRNKTLLGRPLGAAVLLLAWSATASAQDAHQAPALSAPALRALQPFVGAGEGGGAVRVLTTDGVLLTGYPWGPAFTGGVRVATGDINGDGTTDLVVGTGTGAGSVRVFSGVDATVLLNLAPFGPGFTGGVYVATGDLNGDGRDDVIVGAGTGSGLARVISGDGTDLGAGYPYGPAYSGGVTVATGDVNGDGQLDVITGMAFGGYVRVFSGLDYSEIVSGFPYGPLFTGGVNVAAGDLNGDGRIDVVTAPVAGNAPVQVFNVANVSLLLSVTPFPSVSGTSIAVGDVNSDGRADLILGAGPGGAPHVCVLSGVDGSTLLDAFAFDALFRGGVYVAGLSLDAVRFTSAASAAFRVGTAGTFTVRTAGAVGATLSAEGALPAGLTFTDNADGTGTLAGTPAGGTAGTHLIQLRATRSGAVVASQDFTIVVQEPPVFTSAAATTFAETQAGMFAVTTTGSPTATLSVSGALPTGVMFTDQGNGTAHLSGTPAATTAGSYPLTITATNAAGSATQSFTLTVAGTTPVFTSAATTTFIVRTAGAFTVRATASPAVTTFSVTGTLPADVTLTNNGDGTATLGGTPATGTAGSHTFTLNASNGTGSAAQTFTLLVHQAAAITSAATTTFTTGSAGSFTVTTTGLPAPTLSVTGALPTGVTFVDNGDGTATLAGPATTTGTFPLTITATNGVSTAATQAFTLSVQGGAAITSAATTTFVVGTAESFAVTTSGTPPVNSITQTGALPAGVSFAPSGPTALLAGTPAAGAGGVYPIAFTASNGVGGPAIQNFTLTVNEAPAFTNATSTTFGMGVAGTFAITTTGFPHAALTLSGDALPSSITFVDNTDGTATLSGTAAVGTSGTYNLIITASNGVGPAMTQTFTLTVTGVAITSANTTTLTVGQAGAFTITTGGTPAVTSITRSAEPLPNGVTFTDNGATATLAGTPAAGTGGSYTFTLTADNGTSTATQTYTLVVQEAPAITSANTMTLTVGTPGAFTVTTTGFPAPSIARGGVTLPAGVTWVDNGNGTGTLSGMPAPGSGGSYAITFTANNGVGTDAVQAFTLNVNEAPAITSGPAATFPAGTASSFTVTTIGFPTNASMTITQTGDPLPGGVTFTNNGSGTATLAGTPAAGAGGVRTLTITAANGIAPNAVQTFTLTVSEAPSITSANAVTFTAGTPGSFTITTTGTPAPTIGVTGTLPSGVTFTNNGNGTGTLSGNPEAGTGGTYPVSFTATNGVGTDATQTFTLTVNQAPAFTSPATTTFTVGTAGTFTITTSGVPPVAAIARTGAALPADVVFTDNGNGTATLSGTPQPGTGGTYNLVFTINNGVGGNIVQNFTLNVEQAPAFTSAASDTFVVGTADSFTVTASGFPAPTITHTSGTLPTGITFTAPTLGGTATQTGTFPLQFTAANGVGSNAAQAFTLTVVCPTISVTPLSLANGLYKTAYTPVDFNQTGSTGSIFTWTATGLLTGMTINATTGEVSGTPTNTVLNGAVTITVTDNFGCQGSVNTTLTVRPTTDNETYSGGVGNTQYATGAPFPTIPHVVTADNVKTGDSGPGSLTVTFPATSANGAIVEGSTDGTFLYTPNVGFAGPSDTFTYTLTDGNGVTNTGTVTINLSNLVWYVNGASGVNGDGRSHSPFNTLASAGAPSNGGIIYVHTGGVTTPGSVALDANQTLHGQGVALTVNSLTIPSGTRPTLTGTVTLANNTAVQGLNFSGGSPAMNASGVAFSLLTAIDQVNVTGGSSALSLTNVTATATGAINVSNATFTNTTGAEVTISGGNIPVTLAATVTISSNAGRSIDIQSRTGGTITFNGPITDAGQGIFLNANTGSTINFTGGLALTTTTSPGFTATGGGTVSATQNNTTIVNTITTTTGTALNVANTTIGAAGLTFRSISANGAANGIVLNTTGTTGGLTVTGNGGTCTPAAPTCTGGRIQNTVGADNSTLTPVGTGIVLNNTSNVSLTRMRLDNHSNYAVRGTSVNGLVFDSGLVDGANGTNVATPFNDGSFVFLGVTGSSSGLTGTSAITNSTIQGGHQRNIAIDNSVGTLNLTVSGNTIRRTSDAAGDDGFFLEADTTANVTVAITNNLFARHGGDHINISMVNNAVVDATITGNTLHGNYAGTPEGNHPIGLGQGILLFGAAFNGTVTYNITNNGTVAVPFRGNRQGGAIHVNKGSGTGTFSGSITNNVIGDPAVVGSGSAEAFGIIVGARGAGGSHTTLVDNNQVRQYFDRGIVLQAGEGSAALNATVTNNTVTSFADAVNSLHGIHSDNGILSGDNNAVCLNISGNSVGTAGNEAGGGADIRVRRSTSGNVTVAIPGIAGTNNAAAIARLQALNPTATTVSVTGNGFSNIASCPVP